MSQIGYMVLAAGLGPAGYAFAIMHLLTHGFFKAGLFLGAGSVMHAMDDEVNMRRYGGLRKLLPITFATFGLGYLAIIGVPPLAGFFSKDGIIEAALGAGGAKGIILGGAAMLGAGITAFYMTRVMLMTFFGEKRWKADTHPHESPARDDVADDPAGRRLGGIRCACSPSAARWSTGWNRSSAHTKHTMWCRPGSSPSSCCRSSRSASSSPTGCTHRRRCPTTAPEEVSALTVAARRDLYGDAFNEDAVMRPGQVLTKDLVWIDDKGVDGVGKRTGRAGRTRRRTACGRLQTGFARSYALSMLAGAALVVAVILAVQLW